MFLRPSPTQVEQHNKVVVVPSTDSDALIKLDYDTFQEALNSNLRTCVLTIKPMDTSDTDFHGQNRQF